MKIVRFEDIKSWKEARRFAKEVYALSKSGPFARDFRLRDQIRDAAGSIMHNIAEGFDGGSHPELRVHPELPASAEQPIPGQPSFPE